MAAVKKETFESLCEQLGERVRKSAVENAMLCHRAYRAFLIIHPETGQGKAPKDGSSSVPKFSALAAKHSGLSISAIDALKRIGAVMSELPAKDRARLAASSIANSTNLLRRIAEHKNNDKRAKVLEHFLTSDENARETGASGANARDKLEKALGLKAQGRTGTVEKKNTKTTYSDVLKAEHREFKVGRTLVRITLTDARVGIGSFVVELIEAHKREEASFLPQTTDALSGKLQAALSSAVEDAAPEMRKAPGVRKAQSKRSRKAA
jgi:hypothetical protein